MSEGSLYLVQTSVYVPSAVKHFKAFLPKTALEDDTLLLKSALTEGFGGPVVRPWCLHALRGPSATIVGYSHFGTDELNTRRMLALPSIQSAVTDAMAAKMPVLRVGEHFQFSVSLVPTIRVTVNEKHRHGERDAFLATIDRAGEGARLVREIVYTDYLRERLKGATIQKCRMTQFQLRKLSRPQDKGGFAARVFPEAHLEGVLSVQAAERLTETLSKGVGRQRAYGYGMVRLEPMKLR